MTRATLVLRRMLAQAPLFAAIVGVIALTAVLLAGLPRYLAHVAIDGARSSLESADPTDAAVRVQLRLADDAAEQTSAMAGLLDSILPPGAAGYSRTVESPALDATLPDGSSISVLLAAGDDFEGDVELVSGDWPEAGVSADDPGPVRAAVQQDAAASLGLALGDQIEVTGGEGAPVTLEIVATWRATDAADPIWFGEAAIAGGTTATGTGDSGAADSDAADSDAADSDPADADADAEAGATPADGVAYGPFVVAEPVIAALDVDPFARWTVVPATDTITSAQFAPLREALDGLEESVRDAPGLVTSGVIVAGSLSPSIATLERAAAAARGVSPVPLVLAAVIGFIGLLQLARLLTRNRAGETLLLGARGRSPAQAAGDALLEAALCILPGAAIGVLAALAFVPDNAVRAADALIASAGVAVVGVASFTWVAFRAASAPPVRTADTSRASRGVSVGFAVLVLAAAAVSLWQFRLYGSPLVIDAAGESVVDPIAVLAPALGLLALASVLLLLFGPLTSIVEAWSSSRGGADASLATRQVRRSVGVWAVPVLLVSLAVGGSTVSATYAGTWSALNTRAGELRNGADVRVVLGGDDSVAGPDTTVSAAPYSAAAMSAAGAPSAGMSAAPVLVLPVEADDAITLIALAPDAVQNVMSDLGGSFDGADVAASLDTEPPGTDASGTDAPGTGAPSTDAPGIALPGDAARIGLTAAVAATAIDPTQQLTPGQGGTTLVVWLQDAQGALARVPLEEPTTDPVPEGVVAASAPLPEGVAPWSLLAIDAQLSPGFTPASYDIAVTAISTRADAADGPGTDLPFGDQPWQVFPDAVAPFDGQVFAADAGIGAAVSVRPDRVAATVRLMPASATGDVPPILIVVTDALAERLGFVEGDEIDLAISGSGRSIAAVVSATVPLIPGTLSPLAAVASLPALNDQLLRTTSSVPRPGQVWISDDSAVAGADIAGDSDDAVTAAEASAPDGAVVTAIGSGSGAALLRPTVTALWIGSAGLLLLAVAALGAVVATLSRDRRPEVTILRALGMSAQQQGRGRRRELGTVASVAVVFGVLAGAAVSLLTVADLARSAVLDVPRSLGVPLSVDILPLAALLAGFTVLAAGVIEGHVRQVRRQALRSTGRGDS